MLVRFMLLGYGLLSLALAFHLGQSLSFYPEGWLFDCAYGGAYWYEYKGVAQ
jgi:hypothetical protein